MTKESILQSVAFFILAGLCEIGGGYMVWNSVKNNSPLWTGILGGVILAAYGLVATLQPAGFGRTYAAYGGVFVVIALLWGWAVDKTKPDAYDIVGGLIVLTGAAIIVYAPRKII